MKDLILLGAYFAVVVVLADWTGLLGESIGKGYCKVRHPVEWFTPVRKPRGVPTACESQHVMQRQCASSKEEKKKLDKRNTIWINGVEHMYADKSKHHCPWDCKKGKRPWMSWLVDDNAERAYMMGAFANGFHFTVYDHHGKGHSTITEWDGVSHLTYLVASVLHFISKEISYLGYQWERTWDGRKTQWIDAILGIFVDFVEVALGLGYSVVGVVVGTLFNPLDTVKHLPGGILLIIESAAMAVWYTVSDIISLFTLGVLQLDHDESYCMRS